MRMDSKQIKTCSVLAVRGMLTKLVPVLEKADDGQFWAKYPPSPP